MTIRLKLQRRQEEQARKIGELMQMYSINVPIGSNYNYYQPVGGSSLVSNSPADPRTQKVKSLFEMFHLAR